MKTSFINNILNSQQILLKFALNCLCAIACLFRHIYFWSACSFLIGHFLNSIFSDQALITLNYFFFAFKQQLNGFSEKLFFNPRVSGSNSKNMLF